MASTAAFTFDFDSQEFRGTSPRRFAAYLGRRFEKANFAVTRGALEAMLPDAADAHEEVLFAAAAGHIVQAVYCLHNKGVVKPGALIVIDRDNWRDKPLFATAKPGSENVHAAADR